MKIIFLLLCVAAFSFSVSAQTKVRVKFAKGENAASLNGRVAGYKYVDYVVGAKAGQTLSVNLESANESLEIYVFDGSMKNLENSNGGTEFSGELAADGNYTIRVLLPRSAARRKGAAANFELTVAVD